jgi:undecaprenyl-diphosphatase
MTIFEAIILGIVQGLTEFLPVSSSGHLALVQQLMGVDGDVVFFDLMLHLGTLAAVFTVWHAQIFNLFKKPYKSMGLLILASVPAVVVMLALGESIEELFSVNPRGSLLCFMFLITAVLLIVTEYVCKKSAQGGADGTVANDKDASAGKGARGAKVGTISGVVADGANCAGAAKKGATVTYSAEDGKALSYKGALLMGLFQGAAVVPGISRSGSTICGGMLYGVKRDRVAEFSFLMSIPIIAGSAFVKLISLDSLANIYVLPTLFGMLAAGISGYFAIRLMIKLINKINFKYFSFYLFALFALTFLNSFVVTIW